MHLCIKLHKLDSNNAPVNCWPHPIREIVTPKKIRNFGWWTLKLWKKKHILFMLKAELCGKNIQQRIHVKQRWVPTLPFAFPRKLLWIKQGTLSVSFMTQRQRECLAIKYLWSGDLQMGWHISKWTQFQLNKLGILSPTWATLATCGSGTYNIGLLLMPSCVQTAQRQMAGATGCSKTSVSPSHGNLISKELLDWRLPSDFICLTFQENSLLSYGMDMWSI